MKFSHKLTVNRKRFLKNFFSLSVIKFMDMLMPLLVVPILIHRVGLMNYGKYAFAYSVIFYFLNITQYGFSLTGVREIALSRDSPDKLNSTFSSILSTKIFLCFVSLLILFLIVFVSPEFRDQKNLYIFLSLIIIGDTFSMTWFFQGQEKMQLITLVNFFSKVTFILFVYFLINQESDFIYIGLYQSIGFIVSAIISFYLVRKQFKVTFKFVEFRQIKTQMKEGFGAFLTLVSPLLYANSSVFLTGFFGLPQHVSFIEIASKISGGFTSLNNIVAQVFFPFLNKDKSDSKSKKVRRILITVGFIFSIFMLVVAPLIVELWLPENYIEINKVVKILALSPFFISISNAFGMSGLMVINRDILYSKVIILGSLIGFTFALIFIPKYLHIAAAYTFVISRGLIAAFTYLAFKKYAQ